MGEDPFAADGTCSATLVVDASDHIRRNRVAAVAQLAGWLGGFLGSDGLRLKAREHAGDYVSRVFVSWPSAKGCRPGFAAPGVNRAVLVECSLLVDHTCGAIVFGNEFILSRKLHADWPVHGLGQKRGVVGNGIGGIQSVTAGTTNKDHLDFIDGQAGK